MALFKSIGNVFRRPEDRPTDRADPSVTLASSILPATLSSKILATSATAAFATPEESPDLYYEDRALGHSIHGLEEVRLSLREVSAAANHHKDMLVASSNTERHLGDALANVMRPVRVGDENDRASANAGEYADLALSDDAAAAHKSSGRDENSPATHFSNYLPVDAREAQKALGRGLVSHSDGTIKLSVAMSTPINDLTRSFEERYTRKIVPLRRRYMDQKGQYLKYKRNSDMAENDEKRSYYEALAEAAKPVWMRTSTELRTESDVMTELTAKNLAKWSRSLALQHERALAIAAANFADAFNRAKTLTSLSRVNGK